MSEFSIGTRPVGDGAQCLIVAEVGLAHDGSLSQAHAYIEAAAKAGVDAIKYQCHIADAESDLSEQWRVKPEWPQDAGRYDYWRRTAFRPDEWYGLDAHARDKGLEFLCSPFSVAAVKLLDTLVRAWKVPSGEITNGPLLIAIQKTGKPVIVSSGMATRDEVLLAEKLLGPSRVWTLQCTSIYPCPAEKVGLLSVDAYDGLSDHSGTIYPGLAAVALGAKILEVHVCFSKEQGGFDTSSSLDLGQLAQLVEGVRFIEKALQPVNKNAMARELEPIRKIFMGKHERKQSYDIMTDTVSNA